MNCLLLLTILCSLGLCAENKEIRTEFESDHAMIASANQKLAAFEEVLSWYLTQEDKEMERQCQLTQAMFNDFRYQCSQTLALQCEGHSFGNTLFAFTLFDLTEWYIDYMEKNLFPDNWKELYAQSKAATAEVAKEPDTALPTPPAAPLSP